MSIHSVEDPAYMAGMQKDDPTISNADLIADYESGIADLQSGVDMHPWFPSQRVSGDHVQLANVAQVTPVYIEQQRPALALEISADEEQARSFGGLTLCRKPLFEVYARRHHVHSLGRSAVILDHRPRRPG